MMKLRTLDPAWTIFALTATLLPACDRKAPDVSGGASPSAPVAGQPPSSAASDRESETSGLKDPDQRADGTQGEANDFLESNAQRAGVEVTTSGLQYEILKPAPDPNAPKPSAKDTVEIHYHGTLADGAVFDSSINRGEPIAFAIAGVIPGWVEALQLMTVGEKRRVFLPPALGYGVKGAGSVPPHAVLIFELELLGIQR